MSKSIRISRLAGFFVLIPALALAQSSYTAAVRGTVTDPSGGAIPGAKVVVLESERNVPHPVTTDEAGRYVVTALPPGQYTLSVEAAGFKKYSQVNIQLAVQQQATFDVPMQIGELATQVEVQTTTPLLNTTAATLGQVVEQRMMMALPNIGRNALQYLGMTAGLVGANSQTTTPTNTNFVANGARNSTSDVLVDGAIVNTTEQNTGSTDLKYVPSVDAVQEFKAQVNWFGAEYAESGGAVINLITKSGTNGFHGDAYYYRRDSTLNANSWSNNRNGAKKTYYRRDQPGFVVGGPIRPNKTFFFFTLERTKSKSPQTYTGSSPIAPFRTGDFSTLMFSDGKPMTIYNPFSTYQDSTGATKRNPFPGNIIPTNMIDPVSSKVMKYIPTPNATPTNQYTRANNFYMQGINLGKSLQSDIKIDNSFTNRIRATGRYSIARSEGQPANLWEAYDPAIAAAYSPNDGPNTTRTQSASGNLTFVQNPTTIWVLNYGFVYSDYQRRPFEDFDSTTLGLPKYFYDNAAYKAFPFFSGWGLDVGTQGWLIMDRQEGVHQPSLSLTKTIGGHTIKTGTEYRQNFLDYAQPGYPQGQLTFGQQTTSMDLNSGSTYQGNSFASFLLGWGNGGQYANDPKAFMRASYLGFFVQDDWKVSRKLTLNLGLRYEFDIPRHEVNYRTSYWDLSADAPIKVPGYTLKGVFRFNDANNPSPFDKDLDNFAPRLGVAYAVNSRTSIRAGAGIFYTLSRATVAGHTGSPFSTNPGVQWSLDSNATRYASLANPYPAGMQMPLGSTMGVNTLIGQGAGTILRDSGQNPEMYNWNASFQREIGWESIIEINYTGSRGAKLPNAAATSMSLLNPMYWGLGRTALQARVPNPFYGIITDPKATNLNGTTVQYYRLLRNMPHFDGAGSSELGNGDSWYHGLQMRYEKRFSRGLTMQAHYTWSKMLDDVSNGSSNLDWLSSSGGRYLQNNFDYRQEKSLSSNDVAHRFVAVGDYQLPIGRGKQFAANVNRVVDGIIGGWEVSAFFLLQSSQPLQVTQNGGTLWSGTQRPNLIGDPSTTGSVYDRWNTWFNVNAFSQPAADTFGSAPRFLNVRGPRINTLDAALMKSWKTTEHQRLEYRVEASNVRNHPVFNPPGTTFGSGSFGQITSTKIGSRAVQMSLKYYF
jgi:Carboxypeptidase regulatory-like domain/TonB dependent receptor